MKECGDNDLVYDLHAEASSNIRKAIFIISKGFVLFALVVLLDHPILAGIIDKIITHSVKMPTTTELWAVKWILIVLIILYCLVAFILMAISFNHKKEAELLINEGGLCHE